MALPSRWRTKHWRMANRRAKDMFRPSSNQLWLIGMRTALMSAALANLSMFLWEFQPDLRKLSTNSIGGLVSGFLRELILLRLCQDPPVIYSVSIQELFYFRILALFCTYFQFFRNLVPGSIRPTAKYLPNAAPSADIDWNREKQQWWKSSCLVCFEYPFFLFWFASGERVSTRFKINMI